MGVDRRPRGRIDGSACMGAVRVHRAAAVRRVRVHGRPSMIVRMGREGMSGVLRSRVRVRGTARGVGIRVRAMRRVTESWVIAVSRWLSNGMG